MKEQDSEEQPKQFHSMETAYDYESKAISRQQYNQQQPIQQQQQHNEP